MAVRLFEKPLCTRLESRHFAKRFCYSDAWPWFDCISVLARTLLLLAFLAPSPVLADGICQSEFLFLEYLDCEHPSHGVLREELREEKCGIESYRICTRQLREYVTSVYLGEDFGGDDAACARAAAKYDTAERRRELLESTIYNYLNHRARGPLTAEQQKELEPSVREAIYAATMRFYSAFELADSGDCTANYLITGTITAPDEECGIQNYKACRLDSHPVAPGRYLQRKTKACGLNLSRFGMVSPAKASLILSLPGTLECAIRSDSPENSLEKRNKKIVQLGNTLRVLKASNIASGTAFASSEALAGAFEPATADRQRGLRLRVALEMVRLAAPNSNEANKARQETLEALRLFGDLEHAVDSLLTSGRSEEAKSLIVFLPQEWAELQRQTRPRFLDIGPELYAFAFPATVQLSDSEYYDAVNQLHTISGSDRIYRLAEAFVRSGLARLRVRQAEALQLMDLRVRFARDTMNVDEVSAQLASITSESPDKYLGKLSAYAQSKANLQRWLANFVSARVAALQASNAEQKRRLWQAIELAKQRSRDPRLPLLDAYRNLFDLDANAFSMNLRAAITSLPKAPSVHVSRTSISLLVASARENLSALSALQALLQTYSTEKESVRSIIGEAQAEIGQADLSDEFFILVYQSMEIFGEGGPGAEDGLLDAIQTRVASTFGEFSSVLRRLPELDHDP
ncbi:hypothetical protein [Mesorhizobium sp. M0909]|uniref:hypothetical protein n=1 Tax=Mesorhizobium sp. M0909 TaxID=2957024 RepID=UPI003337C65B